MGQEQPSKDRYAAKRSALVRSLQPEIRDSRVLAALALVPRERFVIPELQRMAYEDRPLPIGYGQTISQPRIVALMLQLLRLEGSERVLDVGAGSGYQTALLAELAHEVVGVELVPELAERAARVLTDLGYVNAKVMVAGDELGWPQGAPYDAIIVAAAAPVVPKSLLNQLAREGRLVIPVGNRDVQDLLVVHNSAQGVIEESKGPCRFVPLVGKDSYPATSDPQAQPTGRKGHTSPT